MPTTVVRVLREIERQNGFPPPGYYLDVTDPNAPFVVNIGVPPPGSEGTLPEGFVLEGSPEAEAFYKGAPTEEIGPPEERETLPELDVWGEEEDEDDEEWRNRGDPLLSIWGDNFGGIEGTEGMQVGSPDWMEYVYGPQAGYLSALGLFGKQSRTPYQSYMESLYGPLARLYDLQSQMAAGGLGESPGATMNWWSQRYARNPAAMYNRAGSMLGNVMGMTPEQRASFGLQGPTAGLQDLMGMGLRSQLGIPGSTWLANRLPFEEEQWIAQYPQQQGPSFMDYIVDKYGLGQYFGGV